MGVQGFLVDVEGTFKGYKLYFKTENGIVVKELNSIRPSCYLEGNVDQITQKLDELGVNFKIEDWMYLHDPKKVVYIEADTQEALREIKRKVEYDRSYEFALTKLQRFLLHSGLELYKKYDLNEYKEVEGEFKPKFAAIDIEVAAHEEPDPKKDEIILVSYYDGKNRYVFSLKDIDEDFVIKCNSEKELIEKFARKIEQESVDVLLTYNGDKFDIPYLRDRARAIGTKFAIYGNEPKMIRKGKGSGAKIPGIAHVDVFDLVFYLSRIGAVKTDRYGLYDVYKSIFGEEGMEEWKAEKSMRASMKDRWDAENDLRAMARYNLQDSISTYKIALEFIQLELEKAKLINHPLYESSRMSSGQIVENLLIKNAHRFKELIPNRPKQDQIAQRFKMGYEGGFVFQPQKGLHENIAVVDFTSLYPTIIMTFNICPTTLNKCENVNVSPTGDRFCKDFKGFFPSVLEQVYEERIKWKRMLKTLKKGTPEYKSVYAKQWALKIVINSFYGILGYPKFRWYTLECARSTTAWARYYIKYCASKAEDRGLKVIYGDTDSLFLQYNDPSEVREFVDAINSELPGKMNLELEGIFKRGLFVSSRKGGEKAAKKKYALAKENGDLKISGFELVRRDWSELAKKVQHTVLEMVLNKGDVDGAVKYVNNVINDIKAGKVKLEDMIIRTRIRKELEDYASVGPHVAAVKKARERGKEVFTGSIIEYIVTSKGKSISDKAELAEFAKDYDKEYYINNQIIPAVISIFESLGYDRDQLINGFKQRKIDEWF